MHPAPSVIIFTVFSGLGFGFLTYLGLGILTPTGATAFLIFALAYALAVGGLLAATFHLGNPKNGLKAFSQWRTSWLSREAWSSVACLTVLGFYALGAVFFDTHIRILGILGAVLALVTVYFTSMIYAQLKTVPRWNHWMTSVVFGLFSLGGGALLSQQGGLAAGLLIALGVAMAFGWVSGDQQFAKHGSTMETATGLGKIGRVRLFESPHTGGNYLLHEMVYVVGRKHAVKLRVIAILCAVVLPLLLLWVWPANTVVIIIAALVHILGALVARWLFFAEAEHVVGLYYGKR